jgi:hypothetical protein
MLLFALPSQTICAMEKVSNGCLCPTVGRNIPSIVYDYDEPANEVLDASSTGKCGLTINGSIGHA